MTRADWLSVAAECFAVAAGFLLGGPYWGVAFLVGGSIALAIWFRMRDDHGGGMSWTDIEVRMKELRLKDIQHGLSGRRDGPMDAVQDRDASGLHCWRLLGSNKELRAESERFFALAGRKLKSSGMASSPRLAHETDDFSRWLWFLVELGDYDKDVTSDSVIPETGRVVQTHTYWLTHVLNDSVAACLECLKHEGAAS